MDGTIFSTAEVRVLLLPVGDIGNGKFTELASIASHTTRVKLCSAQQWYQHYRGRYTHNEQQNCTEANTSPVFPNLSWTNDSLRFKYTSRYQHLSLAPELRTLLLSSDTSARSQTNILDQWDSRWAGKATEASRPAHVRQLPSGDEVECWSAFNISDQVHAVVGLCDAGCSPEPARDCSTWQRLAQHSFPTAAVCCFTVDTPRQHATEWEGAWEMAGAVVAALEASAEAQAHALLCSPQLTTALDPPDMLRRVREGERGSASLCETLQRALHAALPCPPLPCCSPSAPSAAELAGRMSARWHKRRGDLCLLAGALRDARRHYREAAAGAASWRDEVWLAGALEGQVAAHALQGAGEASRERARREACEVYRREVLPRYAAAGAPLLHTRAALHLARFLTEDAPPEDGGPGGGRARILEVLQAASQSAHLLLPAHKVAALEGLSECYEAIGAHRKANFLRWAGSRTLLTAPLAHLPGSNMALEAWNQLQRVVSDVAGGPSACRSLARWRGLHAQLLQDALAAATSACRLQPGAAARQMPVAAAAASWHLAARLLREESAGLSIAVQEALVQVLQCAGPALRGELSRVQVAPRAWAPGGLQRPPPLLAFQAFLPPPAAHHVLPAASRGGAGCGVLLYSPHAQQRRRREAGALLRLRRHRHALWPAGEPALVAVLLHNPTGLALVVDELRLRVCPARPPEDPLHPAAPPPRPPCRPEDPPRGLKATARQDNRWGDQNQNPLEDPEEAAAHGGRPRGLGGPSPPPADPLGVLRAAASGVWAPGVVLAAGETRRVLLQAVPPPAARGDEGGGVDGDGEMEVCGCDLRSGGIRWFQGWEAGASEAPAGDGQCFCDGSSGAGRAGAGAAPAPAPAPAPGPAHPVWDHEESLHWSRDSPIAEKGSGLKAMEMAATSAGWKSSHQHRSTDATSAPSAGVEGGGGASPAQVGEESTGCAEAATVSAGVDAATRTNPARPSRPGTASAHTNNDVDRRQSDRRAAKPRGNTGSCRCPGNPASGSAENGGGDRTAGEPRGIAGPQVCRCARASPSGSAGTGRASSGWEGGTHRGAGEGKRVATVVPALPRLAFAERQSAGVEIAGGGLRLLLQRAAEGGSSGGLQRFTIRLKTTGRVPIGGAEVAALLPGGGACREEAQVQPQGLLQDRLLVACASARLARGLSASLVGTQAAAAEPPHRLAPGDPAAEADSAPSPAADPSRPLAAQAAPTSSHTESTGESTWHLVVDVADRSAAAAEPRRRAATLQVDYWGPEEPPQGPRPLTTSRWPLPHRAGSTQHHTSHPSYFRRWLVPVEIALA